MQSLDEHGQAEDHEDEPRQHRAQVGKRLSENHRLEKDDNQHHRRQVANRLRHHAEKALQDRNHGRPIAAAALSVNARLRA